MTRPSHRLRFPAVSDPAAALALAGILLAGILFPGCAELKDKIPAPTSSAISVHAEGWTDPASAQFHGKEISADDWDMGSCKTCHGADYSGGTAAVSCQTCHTNAGGPENCATCHGGPNSPAPPGDLAGNSTSSSPGVGAHVKHVLGGALASKIWCYECHNVPTSVYAAGHVDSDLPAEVPMAGPLARTVSNGIAPVPVHDYGALTCSNTYCHGNWKARKSDSPNQFVYMDSVMVGANASPIWTGGPSEAACGTCHSAVYPPDTTRYIVPQGHTPFAVTACANCHSPVVDAAGKISDKSLHVNGKINVFGSEGCF